MSFIMNIRSVAKYESKILVRSWFFRIFTLLAVVFLGFFNFAMMLMEDNLACGLQNRFHPIYPI